MDIHVYFAVTLGDLIFGRSLRIEAVVMPLAQHWPYDHMVVVLPAGVEAVALLTVRFSVGTNILWIRVAVLTRAARPYAALVWVLVVVAGAIVALVAARRGDTSDDYTPT
ncbi:hypothetical protein ZWY2020_017089 [Hordeum vulgare]|nr:hypothetical protein ZWY2020_017089 [Hordeum vulgare]